MLSRFMLNVFQTVFNHTLLFTGLSESLPLTEVDKRKKGTVEKQLLELIMKSQF